MTKPKRGGRGGSRGGRGDSRGGGRGASRGGSRGGYRGGHSPNWDTVQSQYRDRNAQERWSSQPQVPDQETPDWRRVLNSLVPVTSMLDAVRNTTTGTARPTRVNWRYSTITFVSAGMLDTSLKINDIQPVILSEPQPEAGTAQEAANHIQDKPLEPEPEPGISEDKVQEPQTETLSRPPSLPPSPVPRKRAGGKREELRPPSAGSASSGDEVVFGGRFKNINPSLGSGTCSSSDLKQAETRAPPRSFPPPKEPTKSDNASPRGKHTRRNRRRRRGGELKPDSPSNLDAGVSNLSLEPRLYKKLQAGDGSDSEDDPVIADYIENLMAQQSDGDSDDELQAVVKRTERIQISESQDAVITEHTKSTAVKISHPADKADEETNGGPVEYSEQFDTVSNTDSAATIEQAARDLQAAFDHGEKDTSLYQRTANRMTDEDIAKRLAKQEELGLDSSHVVLLDGTEDFELDDDLELGHLELEAQKYAHPGRKKGKPRPAFIDTLDDDPYQNFDVMDRERPSIRTRGAKHVKPPADISSDEVDTELLEVWEKDRSAKKQRREEREQLRAQGLLGQNGKVDKAAKYSEGMTFDQIRDEIRDLLESEREEAALPPMDKHKRRIVHELAHAFNLKTLSSGSGAKRYPVLYRTKRTMAWSPTMWFRLEPRFLRQFDGRGGGRGGNSGQKGHFGGGGSAAASYREGEVVGAAAPELGAENIGRAMLERMGWSDGTALGALNNKGRLLPVEHVVKKSKTGLG